MRVPTDATASLIPLTVINIGVEYTVTGISDYAFSGCSTLQKITCMQSEPLGINSDAVSGVFKNVNKSTCRLLVPTSSVSAYQSAIGWKGFTTIKSSTVVPAKIYLGNSEAISKNADINEILEQDVTDNDMVYIDDQDVDKTLPANFVKKDASNNWVASGIELTDAMPLYLPANIQSEQVTYTRNFANTNWQAWYVPFDMPYEDIKDKVKVAFVNNVHQYDDDDDGVIDRTVLEFISVKKGVVEGNSPYVVKPFETGEVIFETDDAVVLATTDNAVECQSTRERYVITGNYQPKEDMYSTSAYAMTQGNWKQTADASAILQPFRISLVIISKNVVNQNKAPMRIGMTVDGKTDEHATGIIDLYMQDEKSGDVYNMSGQKVSAPKHGIYIKNGKKYLLK